MMPHPRRARSANRNFDAEGALAPFQLDAPKAPGIEQSMVQQTNAGIRRACWNG
jgi:hypothetical protein